MYRDLEKRLSSLQEPTILKTKSFDELLGENISLTKEVLGSDWKPLESDPYMKKLRVLTLRQLHNQSDKKETIKQLLVTTATGVNLDNLGASENVFRDMGEYPYADFEFSLLAKRDDAVVIPKGLVLTDDTNSVTAKVIEDVVIPAGELKVNGRVALEQFIEQSEIKTENIVTELSFGLDVKQLNIFANGASAEDDERYRLRIIASKDRYSTAGSKEAYIYHAISADSRIDDIVVLSENVLEVNVYLASFSGVDDLMIRRVEDALNKRYVRPLGDKVIVKPAKIVEITIKADIELFDLLQQKEIDRQIKENFKDTFFIGQDFVKSDFIRKCHIDGVYRVNSDFEDVIVSDKEVIQIKGFELNYMEAKI